MKFGLITEETDVEDLIGMVQTIGKQVEESSKVRHNYQVLNHFGPDSLYISYSVIYKCKRANNLCKK